MSNCRPGKVLFADADSYAAIVRAYRRKYACDGVGYWEFYRKKPRRADAITKAAMAEFPEGRRYSHQRRIPRAVLNELRRKLLLAHGAIKACSSFEQLLRLVEHLKRGIGGVGELMVYDTAHRIGAFLNLRPTFVYLHAGTRLGAKALGLD